MAECQDVKVIWNRRHNILFFGFYGMHANPTTFLDVLSAFDLALADRQLAFRHPSVLSLIPLCYGMGFESMGFL